MSTITLHGGPFDGKQIDDSDLCGFDVDVAETYGIVMTMYRYYAVYLPDGRGDVEFHAYAPSLEAGLAMLPKEARP